MARRDYAKRPQPPAGVGGLRSGLVAAALLLVVAAAFVGGYFLGRDYGRQEVTQKQRQQLLAELQAQKSKPQRQQQAAKAEHTRFGELTFYTELPSQPVTPAPLAETPAAEPAAVEPPKGAARKTAAVKGKGTQDAAEPPAAVESRQAQAKAKPEAGGRFRVQVASYRSQEKAAALRRRLAEMGISAWVETAEIPGRGRWPRVYAGPYASRGEAEKIRLRIKRDLKIRGLLRQE